MKEDFTEAPRPLSKWNDLQNGIETKEQAVSRPSQLALEYLRWKWDRNYQRKYRCQRELTMNGQPMVVQHCNLLISSCSALMEPRVIINVRPDPPLYTIIRMRTECVGASCEVEDSFLITIFFPPQEPQLFFISPFGKCRALYWMTLPMKSVSFFSPVIALNLRRLASSRGNYSGPRYGASTMGMGWLGMASMAKEEWAPTRASANHPHTKLFDRLKGRKEVKSKIF